ncbi:MAG: uroporphyrinogen-III synthase [Gammaproteobacteria bacterium]|nr:uroporphyrinogen-III synthase [Gammaproteobacteria bacterium]
MHRIFVAAVIGLLIGPLVGSADDAAGAKTLIARQDLPLYNKTILYTAPRNYAGRLGQLMIERGARPIWMPTIVIEPMADYAEFDAALRNRDDYDWIAFTSRNGIEAFFARVAALGLDAADFSKVKFAAIGNDARALRAGGIEPDLVPATASTKGMVSELAALGETDGKVLAPVPEVVGMEEPLVIPEFLAALEEIGLDTQRVPAYVTARATDGLEIGTDLLLTGRVDMIAFTSRGEIDGLLLHLGERRDVLDRDVVLAYFGPVTAAGGRMRDLRQDLVATDYSRFEGYVAAMESFYR